MPANIESGAFANTPAWHREGNVFDPDGSKGMSVNEALELAELDWTVEKVPVFAFRDQAGQPVSPSEFAKLAEEQPDLTIKASDLVVCENRFGVQRATDGRIMGTVGRTWEPYQNREGFQLVEDLLGEVDGYIESGGSLDGGRKVWLLVRLREDQFIAGEAVAQYLLFTNGHDGRSSVTAATTNIRVVCQNTLEWALSDKDTRVHRVRHTVKASDRIMEAHKILGLRNAQAEALARQGEWLASHTMPEGEFNEFLESLFPVAKEQEGKPAETMAKNRRDEVRSVYMAAPNLEPIRGTRWGALNAVVEYADHRREFKNTDTAIKAQFGVSGPQPIKLDAMSLLTKGAPKEILQVPEVAITAAA